MRVNDERSPGGRFLRAVRMSAPDVAPVLHRAHVGFRAEDAVSTSWLMPPMPALTLMFDVSRQGAGEPWVEGMREHPAPVMLPRSYGLFDVKLTPPGAFSILGMPLGELGDHPLALADVVGPAAARALDERVREASDWGRRFDLLEAFLRRRLAAEFTPSGPVTRAWQRLQETDGAVRVGALAREVGWSRRHLSAEFGAQIGLPPKRAARLLRFRALLRDVERVPAGWADAALAHGYYDQPHLDREFRAFTGVTPSAWMARRVGSMEAVPTPP